MWIIIKYFENVAFAQRGNDDVEKYLLNLDARNE